MPLNNVINIVIPMIIITMIYIETSEHKWVNPVLNTIEVNSVRLEGLQLYILHRKYNIINDAYHSKNVANKGSKYL